jgi:hypothetical protein
MTTNGSAYGTGAPSYDDSDLQRRTIEGRLKVAINIRDRAAANGHEAHAAKWGRIADELLDRLLEVRGR